MRRRHQPEVRDTPDRNEFEVIVDGRRAGYLRYRRFPDQIDLIHTEILLAALVGESLGRGGC